jgi:hypothetical protein
VELQTPLIVRSGNGTADLKKRGRVGLARLWAVKVNVDERHSILWQLEVIFEAITHYTELFFFCSASAGLFIPKKQ